MQVTMAWQMSIQVQMECSKKIKFIVGPFFLGGGGGITCTYNLNK